MSITIITPAYNEQNSLFDFNLRLNRLFVSLPPNWEWLIVDDHSSDGTWSAIQELGSKNGYIRGIRLSRNSGAHKATLCGLAHARGDCAIVLAADLQDPPETIPLLLEKWRQDAQVVWAVRAQREGEKSSTVGFSRLYYWLMRKVIGIKEMPATGADFFLLDRRVIDALKEFRESNVSLMSLITRMGFRQESIIYDKQARLHGKSGWSFAKKIKIVVDSIISFSFLPIRLMSIAGFIIALLGFLYAAFVFVNATFRSHPIQGWTSLMIVVLVIGGFQMLMMGILGEYLWRTLDEARRRPRFIIEDMCGFLREDKKQSKL